MDGPQCARRDPRADLAATARIEPIGKELQLDASTHARKQRQERTLEEVKGRRRAIVRSSADANRARLIREEKRRQHRLEHERRAARSPDRKRMVRWLQFAGPEDQLMRSDLIALDLCIADFRGRAHRGEMLTP